MNKDNLSDSFTYLFANLACSIDNLSSKDLAILGLADQGLYYMTDFVKFLANSQLSTDLICLYQHRLSWASHVIHLNMVSCRELHLGLDAKLFLFPLPYRRWVIYTSYPQYEGVDEEPVLFPLL